MSWFRAGVGRSVSAQELLQDLDASYRDTCSSLSAFAASQDGICPATGEQRRRIGYGRVSAQGVDTTMHDTEDPSTIYFRLLLFGEAPSSPLREPGHDLSAAAQVVAAMTELFALIEMTQFYWDDQIRAARLAEISPQQVCRFDAALVAIGAIEQRRLLAIIQRELIEPVAALELAARSSAIAARLAVKGSALTGAQYGVDIEILQLKLSRYLDAVKSPAPELPPAEMPRLLPIEPEAPRSTWSTQASTGSRHVFLLRDEPATASLLDTWLQNCAVARYVDVRGSTLVARYDEAAQLTQVAMWGPLACGIVGEPRDATSAPYRVPRYWLFGRERPQAEELDHIAASFRWSLFPWGSVARQHLLAFVTDDGSLATDFSQRMRRASVSPISAFSGVDALAGIAGGVSFGEDDAFGEAALAAAERDGCAPWLVLAAYDHSGHWWRTTTARLQPELCHWTYLLGRNVMFLAYRGIDTTAWRTLWSRLSYDNNVAVAAVSGHVPTAALRERLVHIKNSASIDSLRYLAADKGWAYAHSWGGGSDEHYALFFSHDPAVTTRVANFAQQQWPQLWPYHGYW
ncbi:MAG: hypothetical protein JNN30_04525 [Rhodanobacteraceae bacterium]|nr:hypothetical protein [Rhodanobacteraceae bacterium]